MSHDLSVEVYWGPRKENIDQCADRLLQFLNGIAQFDEVYQQWYELGQSLNDALKRPIDSQSREQIVELLVKKRNRRDTDKSVIENLGYSFHAWNGKSSNKALSFNVACGVYSKYVSNWVQLELPKELGELAGKELLSELLAAVVKAWEPEWGGVSSYAMRQASGWKGGSPFVDWITYVNRTNIDQSKLPLTASIKLVDELGTIIVAQDHPIDPGNLTDLQSIKMVEAALGLK